MDLGVKSTTLANIISSAESASLLTSATSTTTTTTKNTSKLSKTKEPKERKERKETNECNIDFSNFITIYSLNVGLIPTLPLSNNEQLHMWIPTRSGLWIKVIS